MAIILAARCELNEKGYESTMQQHKSEVARFREQQALEEQSARLGLTGLAAVASHDAIIARMEIGGKRILQLIEEGREEEAHALMNTEWWVEHPAEEKLPSRTRTRR